MKSAIDKLVEQQLEAVEETFSSNVDDDYDQEDSYGSVKDIIPSPRAVQQASEEDEMVATPVKNKRHSRVKPRH